MQITRFIAGMVGTNFYLAEEDDGTCHLIDCPDDSEEILETLSAEGKTISSVFFTHGHFDHTAGVGALKEIFPSARVYLAREDRYLVDDDWKGNRMILKYLGVPPYFLPWTGGIRWESYGATAGPFTVIPCPGHTEGGVSLYSEKDGIVFSGDTLFQGGEGRTDLGGSVEKLRKSIMKILALDKRTLVLPGHGDATTVANERRRYQEA